MFANSRTKDEKEIKKGIKEEEKFAKEKNEEITREKRKEKSARKTVF